MNTAHSGEFVPALTRDGRTLVFTGNVPRGGSFGRMDLWISTRTCASTTTNTAKCNDGD